MGNTSCQFNKLFQPLFQICPFVNSGEWTKKYDDVGKCPYAYYDDQWIGYEDEDSIGIKVILFYLN